MAYWIVGIVAPVYCVFIGITWGLLPASWKEGDGLQGSFAALFWPCTLPVMGGATLSAWLLKRSSERGSELPKATARRSGS